MASASGFPVSLPFTLILERDTALEEIVTVNTISGLNITNCTRGADGTSAVAHNGGAVVEHGVSARDFTEPQAHIAATSGVHGVTGNVVGTTDTQTLTGKTLASPTINTPTLVGSGGTLTLPAGPDTLAGRATTETLTNKTLTAPAISAPAFSGAATGSLTNLALTTPTLTSPTTTGGTADAASTIGGVSGTSLAADRTAWTAYTPTFTNCTSPTGNFAYKQIGKTLHISGHFTGGTATAQAAFTISLPAGLTSAGRLQLLPAYDSLDGVDRTFHAPSGSTTVTSFWTYTAGAALSGTAFSGVIEVA